MARVTPPTLSSYTEIAYSTAAVGTTYASSSVSWQAGDLIVVMAGTEGSATYPSPAVTATGLTFTNQRTNAGGGTTCAAVLATATATSSGSSAITISDSITLTALHGAGIWVWSASDGLGATAEQHTSTSTKTFIPTDTHSAYVWSVFDFNADPATATGTPTPTNTREQAQQAPKYTVYSFDLADRASAGTGQFGLASSTNVGPYTILIAEILGLAAPPELVMAPPRLRR